MLGRWTEGVVLDIVGWEKNTTIATRGLTKKGLRDGYELI